MANTNNQIDRYTAFKNALITFYNNCKEENSRYKSWEHCYEQFYLARTKILTEKDYDFLCLHLAFYLASWGMLRNSFLLQRDYKVHNDVIKIILKSKYDCLLGASCKQVSENWVLLKDLKEEIKRSYNSIRKSIPEYSNAKNEISDVLITKVLMGTLGCVPAYDRFFRETVTGSEYGEKGIYKIASGYFSKNSIKELYNFYDAHDDDLESIRKTMKIGENIEYPQMKLIDMGFWQLGFEAEEKKFEQNSVKNALRNTY